MTSLARLPLAEESEEGNDVDGLTKHLKWIALNSLPSHHEQSINLEQSPPLAWLQPGAPSTMAFDGKHASEPKMNQHQRKSRKARKQRNLSAICLQHTKTRKVSARFFTEFHGTSNCQAGLSHLPQTQRWMLRGLNSTTFEIHFSKTITNYRILYFPE